jgi:hypothetical protein
MRFAMTVGFLGLLVSPMSFHITWLDAVLSNSAFGHALDTGLAEGLLMFATLVVCADTLVF